MTETYLLDVADKIQKFYESLKIDLLVMSIVITDSLITFICNLSDAKHLSSAMKRADELSLALGLKDVAIKREKGNLIIEIKNTEKSSIPPLAELLKAYNQKGEALAMLGFTNFGEMLMLRIDSPSVVHAIITGTTGSGKSALVRQIILSLAYNLNPSQLELHLIDIKKSTFGPMNALSHISQTGVITNPDEGVQKLNELVYEMESRDEHKVKTPMIFVGIEELADWVTTHGDEVLTPLKRLLQRGRECGIHVIALTQKPLASVLGSLGKANFPIKIVGKVASSEDARFASGIKNSGAEKLEGNGDFLIIVSGDAIRFKSFWVNREETDEIIEMANRG